MKKLVYILFCVFVPMLASCDRRVIYEDNLYSAIYDIGTNDWTYLEKATGEPYLAVTLTLKEITKQVCETGSVQCFRVYSDGTQACLPFQTYRKWTDETTGQEITFQDQFDFEFNVGAVYLYYTTSDFDYPDTEPDPIRIRVVVHY